MRVKAIGRSSRDKILQGTEKRFPRLESGGRWTQNELERQERGGQVSQNSGLRRGTGEGMAGGVELAVTRIQMMGRRRR